jgi:hypothetical protein
MYQGIAEEAATSRAAAVKLFCLECVGYVRPDVTNCTATRCPLYQHRPYQVAKSRKLPGLAVQNQRGEGGRYLKAGLSEDEWSNPPKCDGNHGGPSCADPECWAPQAHDALRAHPHDDGSALPTPRETHDPR